MTAQAMAATAARRDIIACPLVQAIPVSCFLLRLLTRRCCAARASRDQPPAREHVFAGLFESTKGLGILHPLAALLRKAPGQQAGAVAHLLARRSSLAQEQLEVALVPDVIVVELGLMMAVLSEELLLERIQPLGERAVKLAVLRGSVADIPD